MRKFTHLIASLSVSALSLASSITASAQWEQCLQLPECMAVFVTSKGTVLCSPQSYSSDRTIQVSDDEGASWTECGVKNWIYNSFFEAGPYIFALGDGGHVARSEDDGHTWIVLNYSRTISDYVSEKEADYVVAYGATYDPELERIYVAIQSGVGVVYSDDYGETWTLADRESLMVLRFSENEPPQMDTYYQMYHYKDKTYLFGIYFIYEYDPAADKWMVVRDPDNNPVSSNFMATFTEKDGVLYAARTQPNTEWFVFHTEDMHSWVFPAYPEGMRSGYVRAIDSDDENIYAATLNFGIYYSPDLTDTWIPISEGLPAHAQIEEAVLDNAISLAHTDNYLFVAMFNVGGDTPGVWRMPLADIKTGNPENPDKPEDGIDVATVCDAAVAITGGKLTAPDAVAVSVMNPAGAKAISVSGAEASVESLPAGVYIYNVTRTDGSTLSGKFIKR